MQKKKPQILLQSNNIYNATESSKVSKDQITVMNCGMEIKWTEGNLLSRNSDTYHEMFLLRCSWEFRKP
jgi:hypothetical protein